MDGGAKPPTLGDALVGGLATVVQQVAAVDAVPPQRAQSRVLRLRSSEEDGIPGGAHPQPPPPPRIPPEHETKRSTTVPPSVMTHAEPRAAAPAAAAVDDQDPTALAPHDDAGGGTGLTPTRTSAAATTTVTAAHTAAPGGDRGLVSVDTEDVPTAPALGFAHLDGLVTVRAPAADDAAAGDVTAADGRHRHRRPSQPAAVVLPGGEVAMLVPAAEDEGGSGGGHRAGAPSLVPTGHTVDGGPAGAGTTTLRRADGSEVTAADVAAARQVAAATLAEMAAAGQLQGFGDATPAPPAPRHWRDRLRLWWARNRRDVIAVVVTTGLIVVVAGLAIFVPFGALILVAGAGLALAAGEAAYTGYRGWARERRLRRLRQQLLDAGTEPALADLAVRGPGVVADDPSAAGPYVPAATAGAAEGGLGGGGAGDAAAAAAAGDVDGAGGERDGGTGGVAPQRHPFNLFRRRTGWGHRLGGSRWGGRDYERLQQQPHEEGEEQQGQQQ